MTSLYQNQVEHLTRKFQLVDDHTVELTDEFVLTDSTSTVNWTLVTCTQPTVTGTQVILQQAGKQMTVQVLSPSQATLTVRQPHTTDTCQLRIRFSVSVH